MSAIKARLGKFATVDDFVEGYAQYFFRGGILLPTRQERREGESVSLHLKVADGSTVLRAEGVVKQTRLNSDGRPVGLVIRFTKLDASSKHVVDRIMDAKRKTPDSGSLQAVPLNAQVKNRLRDNTTGQHLAVQDIAAIADAIDDTFDSIFSDAALPAGGGGPMAGAEDEYLASLGDLGAIASTSTSASGTQPVAVENEAMTASSATFEAPESRDSSGEPALSPSLSHRTSTSSDPTSASRVEPGVPARPDTPLSLIAEASGASERIQAVDTSETTIQRPASGDAAGLTTAELDISQDDVLATPPQLSLPDDESEDGHPAVTTVHSRPAAPDDELDVADVFSQARAEAQSRGHSSAEASVDGDSEAAPDALSLDFIDSTLEGSPRREGQATKDSKAILDALSNANLPAASDSAAEDSPKPQMLSDASSTMFGMPAFDANTLSDASGPRSLAKMELKKKSAEADAALDADGTDNDQGERVKSFISALTEGPGAQSAVQSDGRPQADASDAAAMPGSAPAIQSGSDDVVSAETPFAATMAMSAGGDDFVESVADRVASAKMGEAALDELLAGDETEQELPASFTQPPMDLERTEPESPLQRFIAWLKGLFAK
jgi:Tfp pilus assembly protein PilZ